METRSKTAPLLIASALFLSFFSALPVEYGNLELGYVPPATISDRLEAVTYPLPTPTLPPTPKPAGELTVKRIKLEVGGQSYHAWVYSSSEVTAFRSLSSAHRIALVAEGPSGIQGLTEIMLPMELLRAVNSDPSGIVVFVDGGVAEYETSQEGEYVRVSISYSHSSRVIDVYYKTYMLTISLRSMILQSPMSDVSVKITSNTGEIHITQKSDSVGTIVSRLPPLSYEVEAASWAGTATKSVNLNADAREEFRFFLYWDGIGMLAAVIIAIPASDRLLFTRRRDQQKTRLIKSPTIQTGPGNTLIINPGTQPINFDRAETQGILKAARSIRRSVHTEVKKVILGEDQEKAFEKAAAQSIKKLESREVARIDCLVALWGFADEAFAHSEFLAFKNWLIAFRGQLTRLPSSFRQTEIFAQFWDYVDSVSICVANTGSLNSDLSERWKAFRGPLLHYCHRYSDFLGRSYPPRLTPVADLCGPADRS